MVGGIALTALFALTAVAIMMRPRGIGEGWIAVTGAGVAMALGLVPVTMAAHGLLDALDVLALFAGLLLLAASLSAAGLLLRLVEGLVRRAGGSPARLLLATAGAGVVVTAALSNDACVLLLGPAVLHLVRRLHLPPMPYLLALAFVANSASLILPTGNPVNLLVLDHAHRSAAAFVATAAPPALLGTGVLVAALVLAARGLPRSEIDIPASPPSPDPVLTRTMLGLVVVLVGLDTGAAVTSRPLGVPTLAVGIAAAVVLRGRRSDAVATLGTEAPWGLLPLVAGLAVLGSGLGHLAWLSHVSETLAGHGAGAGPRLMTGAATAALSGALNNLPAALAVSAGLHSVHHLHGLAFPVIAGADLGPNLAPMGSLSTLLIFALARRQGIATSWRSFFAQATWAAPLSLIPILLLAVL